MMRYLLDTNIISNAIKPFPSASLVGWLGSQHDQNLFISSLSVAEIKVGILAKPVGKKRQELETWFAGPEGPQALFAGRVLPFDERAALAWAQLMFEGRATGRPRSEFDMLIAATAQTNNCIMVTDNERDFAGLDILNPMRSRG
jgi:toxin FitB